MINETLVTVQLWDTVRLVITIEIAISLWLYSGWARSVSYAWDEFLQRLSNGDARI